MAHKQYHSYVRRIGGALEVGYITQVEEARCFPRHLLTAPAIMGPEGAGHGLIGLDCIPSESHRSSAF